MGDIIQFPKRKIVVRDNQPKGEYASYNNTYVKSYNCGYAFYAIKDHTKENTDETKDMKDE